MARGCLGKERMGQNGADSPCFPQRDPPLSFIYCCLKKRFGASEEIEAFCCRSQEVSDMEPGSNCGEAANEETGGQGEAGAPVGKRNDSGSRP